MGWPLRHHAPGTCWFVTTRCLEARFLLRPDPEIREALVWWLARAAGRFPGIRLFALVNMGNHLHLLLEDREGDLAAYMKYLLGNFAKDVNSRRNRAGKVFHRRYSAEPVLDATAALDRLVYLVTNPVAANLVERWSDWPGTLLWASEATVRIETAARRDPAALERAMKKSRHCGTCSPDPTDHEERHSVAIHPLDDADGRAFTRARLRASIQEREELHRGERRGPVAGRRALLARSWSDRPMQAKRSPRPLCHAGTRERWQAFKDGWREFVKAYRQASTRLRRGEGDDHFPAWSYPPGRPLVRRAPG